MTLEELEHEVRLLKQKLERYEEAADTIDLWRVNGAENLLGGYGFTQIGRRFRFGADGLQVLSPSEIVSLTWLDKYIVNFDPLTDFPHAVITGVIDPNLDDDGTVLQLRAQW